MIQQTTALRKIASLRKRIKVIRGGQGAGKTVSVLILLINHASSKPDKEILIISAELTKMRITVIKDFVKVMKMAGIYEESRFIAGTLYRFPNGSFIKFIGLDKEDVGKGLRCDIAYFNEVNKCAQESYRQVSTRAGQVIADYNPDAEFYIDRDIIGREDCDFLQLTFRDNELLADTERDEILNYYTQGYNSDGSIRNSYWANLWQVYGLGNIGALHGVVFTNWAEVDQIPATSKLIAYGMDFGYTNDPTTCTAIWQYNNEFYFDEVLYQTGLTNPEIARVLTAKGIDKAAYIYADSAEPKSIQELKHAGLRIKGADKGRDSIMFGIQCMQEGRFYVTSRSVNLLRELRAYVWDTDKNGAKLNKPIDAFNHCIDGIRYYFTTNNKNTGKYLGGTY